MQSVKRWERKRQRGKLPSDTELNMMAQKYVKRQGSGEQESWDLAFENGYGRIQEDRSAAVKEKPRRFRDASP